MDVSEYQTSGDPRLRYIRTATSGPLAATAAQLLMLHGVARRAEDFGPLFAGLMPNMRLIAYDQRGHGGSQHFKSYLVTDYVTDAVAFLRGTIAKPVILYGHSLGAMVAAAVAGQLPALVRGLILEDPPFHTMGRLIGGSVWHTQFSAMRDIARASMSVEQITNALAAIRLPRADGGFDLLGNLRDRASLAWMAECLAVVDPEVFTPIVAGKWLNGYDVATTFARIQCPTVVLQADPKAGGTMRDDDAQLAESRIDACNIVRFPGAGHLLHWLEPDRVVELITKFSWAL